MIETRTVNIGGVVFNINNDAYRTLNDYLHDIELRLSSDEMERTMADIEKKASELLQTELFAQNTQVVDIAMVNRIMEHIGSPSDFGTNKHPHIKGAVYTQRGGCWRVLGITLLVLLFFGAMPILLPLIFALLTICFSIFGIGVPMLFDAESWKVGVAVLSFIAAIIIPIVVIVYLIATYARTRKVPRARFWIISVICWLVSLGCFGTLLIREVKNFGGLEELKQLFSDPPMEMTAACLSCDLPFINAINIDGAVSVDIMQGETPHIAINDSMLVNYQLKDSVLAITGTNINGPRHATVTVTDLSALNISGASKVDLQGNYNELHFTLSGASKLDAENAQAPIIHVNCVGASRAEVNATKELWAQASGASKIAYKGRPALKRNMAVGASKISRE